MSSIMMSLIKFEGALDSVSISTFLCSPSLNPVLALILLVQFTKDDEQGHLADALEPDSERLTAYPTASSSPAA